jgi:hypothetical protein
MISSLVNCTGDSTHDAHSEVTLRVEQPNLASQKRQEEDLRRIDCSVIVEELLRYFECSMHLTCASKTARDSNRTWKAASKARLPQEWRKHCRGFDWMTMKVER